jgi:DNA-directed RNA polymerase subunit N (RpoN/RPB10)
MSSPLVCLYCGHDLAEKRQLYEMLKPRDKKSRAVFASLSTNPDVKELLDSLEVRFSCCRRSLICPFVPIPMLLDREDDADVSDGPRD